MRDLLAAISARLIAALTAPPRCMFCGHAAQTGWLFDPIWTIRGRCPGCVERAIAKK
jgi:hypothetical protein